MQVQDYTTANDLKDSTVKRAWLGVVMGWATFWEVSLKACE